MEHNGILTALCTPCKIMEVDGMAPWMSIFLHFHEYSQGVYVQEFRPSFLHTFLLCSDPEESSSPAFVVQIWSFRACWDTKNMFKKWVSSWFHPGFYTLFPPTPNRGRPGRTASSSSCSWAAPDGGPPLMGPHLGSVRSRFGQVTHRCGAGHCAI